MNTIKILPSDNFLSITSMSNDTKIILCVSIGCVFITLMLLFIILLCSSKKKKIVEDKKFQYWENKRDMIHRWYNCTVNRINKFYKDTVHHNGMDAPKQQNTFNSNNADYSDSVIGKSNSQVSQTSSEYHKNLNFGIKPEIKIKKENVYAKPENIKTKENALIWESNIRFDIPDYQNINEQIKTNANYNPPLNNYANSKNSKISKNLNETSYKCVNRVYCHNIKNVQTPVNKFRYSKLNINHKFGQDNQFTNFSGYDSNLPLSRQKSMYTPKIVNMNDAAKNKRVNDSPFYRNDNRVPKYNERSNLGKNLKVNRCISNLQNKPNQFYPHQKPFRYVPNFNNQRCVSNLQDKMTPCHVDIDRSNYNIDKNNNRCNSSLHANYHNDHIHDSKFKKFNENFNTPVSKQETYNDKEMQENVLDAFQFLKNLAEEINT
ncbi:hypothetical protein A3Q56_02312 [Intoshia linei]|uniref:Uncharacterized protein n=1 Tax=Intoshia linei TaxID=1819745 RepID=A0A177B6Q2_9BILA|nr:hypothetical protein A3Q56_02312 [Intoshia linei]